MPKRPTSSKISAALPADYAPLLAEIKSRVQAARIKAGLAANRELLALYWDIGRLISEAQRAKGYGKQVVERLAADLQREFPGLAGFSPLNVWRMRAFYTAYSSSIILSQPVTESSIQPKVTPPAVGAFVRRPAAQLAGAPPEPMASLPWGHNLLLLHKLEKPEDRLWYAAIRSRAGHHQGSLSLRFSHATR
jgi:predicted nuclease of restriction endonuclease-like (RecB) superfamily